MQCPYCSKDIKDCEVGEFFDCPSCNSALQLENQELMLLKEGQTSSNELHTPLEEENLVESQENPPSEEFVDHFISTSHSPENHQDASPLEDVQSESSTSKEVYHSSPDFENSNILLDEKNNLESVLPETESPEEIAKEEFVNNSKQDGKKESEDFQPLEDIVQFGNSPSQKNYFVYHLTICGVFSKDVQDRVQKILGSKVLKLEAPLLLSRLKDGMFSVRDLNAVKMVYLVRKLSSLPLKIHWTQESKL